MKKFLAHFRSSNHILQPTGTQPTFAEKLISSDALKGYSIGIAVIFFNAIYPMFIPQATHYTNSPNQTAFLYQFLGMAFSLLIYWRSFRPSNIKRINKKHWFIIVCVGLALSLGNWFASHSLEYVSPAIFLSFGRGGELYFTIIIGAIFLGERMYWFTWLGFLIIFFGFGFIGITHPSDISSTPWLGYVYVLFSSVSFASMLVLMRFLMRFVPIGVLNGARFFVAILFLSPFVDFSSLLTLPYQAWIWASLAALSGPVLIRPLMLLGANYISFSSIMLISAMAPILSSLIEVFVFDGTLLITQWLGIAISTFGIVFIVYLGQKRIAKI